MTKVEKGWILPVLVLLGGLSSTIGSTKARRPTKYPEKSENSGGPGLDVRRLYRYIPPLTDAPLGVAIHLF